MATSAIDLDLQPPVGADSLDSRRWVVLGVLCLALMVVGIDGTIVNIALPTLVRELHATSSQLQWIVDAYTIVFAGFLLIAGNTGDRLGRRRCFVLGLVIVGAGSLACSQVDSANTLILFRAVQGFGAAFIMPATLSIIANVFTDEPERARAIALWAGVSGLGVVIGPLAGGYLLEHFWWGSIFLINVPVVILTIVGALVLVPESKDAHAPKLDIVGASLSVVGLVTLLFGIIEGPSKGWTDPLVIGSFVVAVMSLTSFVLWERHTDHPILELGFFANPRFTAASIAVTFVFFAMFGSLFFVSQYMQFVLGYTALQSGVGLLPIAVSLMIAAPASAKLVSLFGTKIVVTLGLVLVAAALFVFSFVSDTSGYPLVAVVLVLIGVGMGLAMAPATESIMGSLPPEKAGVGSAMNDTTREIGGALGVAILGSITAAVYSSTITGDPGFATVQTASPELAAAVKDSVGAASFAAAQLPADVAKLITAAANSAFIHALDRTVIVGAIVALFGAFIAFRYLPARAKNTDIERLIEGAALRLPDDPEQRLGLAHATLGLFADAGMSSLTYNGIAARSGIGTATLERYWGSRVDAVSGALAEVFAAHPVPDTSDIRLDLRAYMLEIGDLLSEPRSRQVIGALVSEAASDESLAAALRERVSEPRRRELETRLRTNESIANVPIDTAIDQLIGPIYYRTVIIHSAIDERLVDAILDAVLTPNDDATNGHPTRTELGT